MPEQPAAPTWDQVRSDPDYLALSEDEQLELQLEFFGKRIAADPDFQSLARPEQAELLKDFFWPSKVGRLVKAAGRALAPVVRPIAPLERAKRRVKDVFPEAPATVEELFGEKPEVGAALEHMALNPRKAAGAAARTGVELLFPTTPLDVGMLAAGPLISVPGKVNKARAAVRTAEAAAKTAAPAERIGVSEATARLEAAAGKTGQAKPKALLNPAGGILEPRLKIEQVKQAAGQVIEQAAKNPEVLENEGRRLFERVAQALEKGEIEITGDLEALITKHGVTPEQFAAEWRFAATQSGRSLKVLSDLQKQLRVVALKDPAVAKLLQGVDVSPSAWQTASDLYRALDKPRRASMVSAPATAIRNAISQTGTYSLEVVSAALSGAMRLPAEGPGAFREAYEHLAAMGRKLTPAARKQLGDALDRYPLEQRRLLGGPVQDVVLTDKLLKGLNIFNSTQEEFFRLAAFDARLRTNLARRGLELEAAAAAKRIPEEAVRDAVDHALKLTFAAAPAKGSLGASVLKVYSAVPVLTSMANPFPRFWANAMDFLIRYSPGGLTRLWRPEIRAAVAGGDTRAATKTLADAYLGTQMFGAALALRSNPEFAGERWYEVNLGRDKAGNMRTMDMRAFAPFSTYLFAAEAVLDHERDVQRLSLKDYAEGAVSINRLGGSSLWVLNVVAGDRPLTGEGMEQAVNAIRDWAGEFAGGYSSGMVRAVGDFIGGEEERAVRSDKEDPLAGPFRKNVPGLQRALPKQPKAVGEGPVMREDTRTRQLTGLTVVTKTPVEQELDRLGIRLAQLRPRTGSPTLDRQRAAQLGPVLEKGIAAAMKSPAYQQASDREKRRLLLEETVEPAKRQQSKVLKPLEDPLELLKAARATPGRFRDQVVERILRAVGGGSGKP